MQYITLTYYHAMRSILKLIYTQKYKEAKYSIIKKYNGGKEKYYLL
jgi:hypothetical protein